MEFLHQWLYFDSYLKNCQQFYSLIVIPFLMLIKSNNIFYEPQITASKSDSNLIPSEKSCRLQITVRLRKFPIYETKGSEERITREVVEIIPLKINVCKLILGQDNSQLPMDLSNTDVRWKSTYYSESSPTPPQVIDIFKSRIA
jgi:hypothetical protein